MRRGYSEVYLHLFVVIFEVVKDIYDERQKLVDGIKQELQKFEQYEITLHAEGI